jgi:hypothetical protein
VLKGVKRIVYKNVANKSHEQFLKVMGFEKMDGAYVKQLL